MAFRTFIDSSGQEWQAYDVKPPADERRRYDRRSNPETVEPDRRSDDRRLSVGRVSRLANAATEGWLCFERGEDRRRLTPLPKNWARCSDEQLEKYRESAQPVHPVLNTGQTPSRKT
jgi:hypothetical protein